MRAEKEAGKGSPMVKVGKIRKILWNTNESLELLLGNLIHVSLMCRIMAKYTVIAQ